MCCRWTQGLKADIPHIDYEDFSKGIIGAQSTIKRQIAPEYSQHIYVIQLTKEAAIGNYMNIPNCSLKILNDTRTHMILLVEELVRLKGYNDETLYLAISIADRYLVNLAV